MAWLRAGDTAAMDERVLGVAELADAEAWSVNEVFGFVARLFLQAAQQGSDYRVSMGTAMALSPRYDLLLAMAARSGLLELVVEEERKVIRLVQDGEFLHLRTRDEISWETDRKADVSDLSLVIPVRVRDGDACRYCGEVVNWSDRKGKRGGTYDHLHPGQRAAGPHELVVACRGCNGGRRDETDGRGARFPLKAPPAEGARYFSSSTIQWFEENGTMFTELGLAIPKRPRGARDRKPGTQTRQDTQPAQGRAETPEGSGPAAPQHSGEQRPAPSQTRPEHAAPQSSGEQRSGASRETPPAPTDGHEVPARTPEGPAGAAPHTSGEQRAGSTPGVHDADQAAAEIGTEVPETPSSTCDNVSVRSDPDGEAEGSRFPGSGRDGSGRAGPGRDGPGRRGQGREARPPVPAAGKRKKRGRRRRGKR